MKVETENIKNHIKLLHDHAMSLGYQKGKLILGSYGQDPVSGKKLPAKHRSFKIGNYKEMTEAAVKLSGEQHRNVYMPLTVFDETIGNKKGGEKDIIGTLGIILDYDDKDAANYKTRLPFPPDFVIESSEGRFQAAYLINKKVDFQRAKPIAEAFTDYSKADSCSKDLSHVWRIPGTFNWPNKKKVDNGRSPEPQLVKYDKTFAGIQNIADSFIQFAEKSNSKKLEADLQNIVYDFIDWDEEIESLDLSERTKSLIINGSDSGDRSKDLWIVLLELSTQLSNENIIKIFESYQIGEKYQETGSNRKEWLSKQIDKARIGPYLVPATEDFDPIIPSPSVVSNLIHFSPAHELVQDIILPDWLIYGYFEKDTVVLFFGDSGTYKSFIAIDIGMHIATGIDWLGNQTVSGHVYYIAGEGHSGIRRRLKAWTDSYGVTGYIPFYVSPHAIQLDSISSTNLLIESIKATTSNPQLIIIDTLATSFGSADENSTKDMNRFLVHVAKIRQELGCTVIVVHHVGHNSKERPRGAYALTAGVDAYFHIEKPENGLTCLRSAGKMKDALPPKDTWFQTKSVILDMDDQLNDITSLVLNHLPEYREPVKENKFGKNEAALFNIVQEAGEIDIKEAQNLFKQVKGDDFRRQGFFSATKSLSSKKLINRNGDILESLDRLRNLGGLDL